MNRTAHRLIQVACAFVAAGAAAAFGQALPQTSPFMPVAGPAASVAAGAKYQLGGMIAKGKDILVSITRVSDKQSFWVPVGGTVNEVTVIDYNVEEDRATINASGERIVLTLRKPVVTEGGNIVATTAAPASAPTPTPPLPPPTGGPEVQEREARMLVTDLLEIGQQHRKAYEEAQRKAAAEKKQ